MTEHTAQPHPTTATLQARLAAIVSSSDDGIVSKTLEGIVESWNDGATRIFGYTAEEMIGQSITKIIPHDRLDEEPQILDKIRRGERVDHFQTIRLRKDGRRIAVSVTISPLKDGSGTIVGASKVVRDFTRTIELERRFEAIVQRRTTRSSRRTSTASCRAGTPGPSGSSGTPRPR